MDEIRKIPGTDGDRYVPYAERAGNESIVYFTRDLSAEGLRRMVARVDAQEKPIHVIGRENAQWVAMDYGDVMVHIFLPEPREYYSLETLWEDAKLTRLPDLD